MDQWTVVPTNQTAKDDEEGGLQDVARGALVSAVEPARGRRYGRATTSMMRSVLVTPKSARAIPIATCFNRGKRPERVRVRATRYTLNSRLLYANLTEGAVFCKRESAAAESRLSRGCGPGWRIESHGPSTGDVDGHAWGREPRLGKDPRPVLLRHAGVAAIGREPHVEGRAGRTLDDPHPVFRRALRNGAGVASLPRVADSAGIAGAPAGGVGGAGESRVSPSLRRP